jgi:hypothetical protein
MAGDGTRIAHVEVIQAHASRNSPTLKERQELWKEGKKMTAKVLATVGMLLLVALPAFATDQGKQSPDQCVAPAKGPIVSQSAQQAQSQSAPTAPARAQVGKKAIDFEANAFYQGKFKNVKLSDYKGKWVVLCFYPGDFTFV